MRTKQLRDTVRRTKSKARRKPPPPPQIVGDGGDANAEKFLDIVVYMYYYCVPPL